MNELNIEDDCRTAIATAIPSARVTALPPVREIITDVPIIVVNLVEGDSEPFAQGNRNNYYVNGTLRISINSLSKSQTISYHSTIHASLANIADTFRISYAGFSNTIDMEGEKPIYVRELNYIVNYKEVF